MGRWGGRLDRLMRWVERGGGVGTREVETGVTGFALGEKIGCERKVLEVGM